MRVKSIPAFPAQFYDVTPVSCLALAYFGLVMFLYRSRWISSPVLGILAIKYLRLDWKIVLFGIVFCFLYLLPTLANLGGMICQHFAPPVWSGPMVHNSFGVARLSRFLMANWVLLNSIVILLSYATTRYFHTDAGLGR